ncbi:hypothetical protein [Roseovarius sp. ZX-A-9]|uniref:hypothetical protein n=1 Tax=Roseovarius sp. ZX-A-9 TaxID=3014783 RepID=UPI0023312D6B|nr:hypothetical protein [Roseovarius sp. ZX-A-9]
MNVADTPLDRDTCAPLTQRGIVAMQAMKNPGTAGAGQSSTDAPRPVAKLKKGQ